MSLPHPDTQAAFCPPQKLQVEVVDKATGEKKTLKNGCLECVDVFTRARLCLRACIRAGMGLFRFLFALFSVSLYVSPHTT